MGLTAEKVAAAVEGQPRGAGRVRAASRTRRRSQASRPASSPTRSRRSRSSTARPTWRPARSTSKTRTVDLDEGPRPDTIARRPGQAAAGVRRQGQRHRRQQLADHRRRRRADPGQREGRQAVRPEAAGALRAASPSRGVPPEIMGIGPIEAIPAALRCAGLKQDDIDWIELNEAFAAQSLAVIDTVGLDPAKVNPMGGAIALGHPLGATGAIRAATVVHALRRHNLKYGMVTMCVGTGRARRASSNGSDDGAAARCAAATTMAARRRDVRPRHRDRAAALRGRPAPTRGSVVIGGAMGVRQDYYAPFAQWLAGAGLRVTRPSTTAARGDSLPARRVAARLRGRPVRLDARLRRRRSTRAQRRRARPAALPAGPQPGRAAAGPARSSRHAGRRPASASPPAAATGARTRAG